MNSKLKYYIVESGEILQDCESFRDNYIKQRVELNSYINLAIKDIESYKIDWDGRLYAVKFAQGCIPEGFCKPKKDGSVTPKIKSKWWPIFVNAPRVVERPDGILVDKYNIPHVVSWKDDEGSGWTRLGSFIYLTQLCWYDQSEPMLLILPDVQGTIDHCRENNPNARLENPEIESWRPPSGLREVLEEEWELMRAKFEQKNKKKKVAL